MPKGETVQFLYQPDRNSHPDISWKADELFFGKLARRYNFSEDAQGIITRVAEVRRRVFDIFGAKNFEVLAAGKKLLISSERDFCQHMTTLDSSVQSWIVAEFAEFDRDFWDTPVSLQNPQGYRRIDDNVLLSPNRFNTLPISSLGQKDEKGRTVRDPVFLRDQVLLCLLTKGNITINWVIAAENRRIW